MENRIQFHNRIPKDHSNTFGFLVPDWFEPFPGSGMIDTSPKPVSSEDAPCIKTQEEIDSECPVIVLAYVQ
jgi:hypothetical protein